tara:strand:+ start:17 stop:646 length:630 start_codon:yes stop_codon:yes gene_type:complete
MPEAIILCGTQGSGKSTYYQRMKDEFDPLFANTDAVVDFVASLELEEVTDDTYRTYRFHRKVNDSTTMTQAIDDLIPQAAEFQGRNICFETTDLWWPNENGELTWIEDLASKYEKVNIFFVVVYPFSTVLQRIKDRKQANTLSDSELYKAYIRGLVSAYMVKEYVKKQQQKNNLMNVVIKTIDNSGTKSFTVKSGEVHHASPALIRLRI